MGVSSMSADLNEELSSLFLPGSCEYQATDENKIKNR